MYYVTELQLLCNFLQDSLVSSLVSPQSRDLFGVPEDGVFNDDDDADDTHSTCDNVYSIGEVSIISEEDEDDMSTCDSLEGQEERFLAATTDMERGMNQMK